MASFCVIWKARACGSPAHRTAVYTLLRCPRAIWLHECDANGATVCVTPTEEHLLETTQLSTATHAHHWRINEPNGEFSHAVCKSCGAERAFRNWLAETDYISRSEIGLAA